MCFGSFRERRNNAGIRNWELGPTGLNLKMCDESTQIFMIIKIYADLFRSTEDLNDPVRS